MAPAKTPPTRPEGVVAVGVEDCAEDRAGTIGEGEDEVGKEEDAAEDEVEVEDAGKGSEEEFIRIKVGMKVQEEDRGGRNIIPPQTLESTSFLKSTYFIQYRSKRPPSFCTTRQYIRQTQAPQAIYPPTLANKDMWSTT